MKRIGETFIDIVRDDVGFLVSSDTFGKDTLRFGSFEDHGSLGGPEIELDRGDVLRLRNLLSTWLVDEADLPS